MKNEIVNICDDKKIPYYHIEFNHKNIRTVKKLLHENLERSFPHKLKQIMPDIDLEDLFYELMEKWENHLNNENEKFYKNREEYYDNCSCESQFLNGKVFSLFYLNEYIEHLEIRVTK